MSLLDQLAQGFKGLTGQQPQPVHLPPKAGFITGTNMVTGKEVYLPADKFLDHLTTSFSGPSVPLDQNTPVNVQQLTSTIMPDKEKYLPSQLPSPTDTQVSPDEIYPSWVSPDEYHHLNPTRNTESFPVPKDLPKDWDSNEAIGDRFYPSTLKTAYDNRAYQYQQYLKTGKFPSSSYTDPNQLLKEMAAIQTEYTNQLGNVASDPLDSVRLITRAKDMEDNPQKYGLPPTDPSFASHKFYENDMTLPPGVDFPEYYKDPQMALSSADKRDKLITDMGLLNDEQLNGLPSNVQDFNTRYNKVLTGVQATRPNGYTAGILTTPEDFTGRQEYVPGISGEQGDYQQLRQQLATANQEFQANKKDPALSQYNPALAYYIQNGTKNLQKWDENKQRVDTVSQNPLVKAGSVLDDIQDAVRYNLLPNFSGADGPPPIMPPVSFSGLTPRERSNTQTYHYIQKGALDIKHSLNNSPILGGIAAAAAVPVGLGMDVVNALTPPPAPSPVQNNQTSYPTATPVQPSLLNNIKQSLPFLGTRTQ